jgi:hypothetical protein
MTELQQDITTFSKMRKMVWNCIFQKRGFMYSITLEADYDRIEYYHDFIDEIIKGIDIRM